jgi:hypothetical protein
VVCEKNGIIVEKAQMSTATVLIMNILVIWGYNLWKLDAEGHRSEKRLGTTVIEWLVQWNRSSWLSLIMNKFSRKKKSGWRMVSPLG